MAEQKTILEKYVEFLGNEYWMCRSCFHKCNGHPNRIIAHLTGTPGKGIKVCPGIIPEKQEELKRELGLRGQQQLQPGEEDDISSRAVSYDVCPNRELYPYVPDLGIAGHRGGVPADVRIRKQKTVGQEKGNKKRMYALGRGTSGSHPTEAEMPLLGASNSGALFESISVSEGNTRSLPNLEKSVGATDSQLGNSELYPTPPENWDAFMTFLSEECTNNDGAQQKNAVGSEPINTIYQGQSSQPESTQVSFPQGGMDMGTGDPIPTAPQVNSDHMSDQHTLPLQHGVGIDASTDRNSFCVEMTTEPGLADEPRPLPCPVGSGTSTPGNASGGGIGTSIPGNAFDGGMASVHGLADEPPPPCPPGFAADLWDSYVRMDNGHVWISDLYEQYISYTDEEYRKDALACLESACFEVRNVITSSPDYDRSTLRDKLCASFTLKEAECVLRKRMEALGSQIGRVEEIETEIRRETKLGVPALGRKRNREMNLWLGHAGCMKSDVDGLHLDAMEAKSPEEILPLLTRVNELIKRADELIETGTSLLNPVAPKDLFSMSRRSQLLNQIPPGQFPQQEVRQQCTLFC